MSYLKPLKDPFFNKKSAKIVSAIGIIMMVWHHLFTYKSWLLDGVTWNSICGDFGNFTTWQLGFFGNICVYIYSFISGYSLWINCNQTIFDRYKKLFKFLLSYWLVETIFLTIGIFNNEELPSLIQLLYNSIGLKTDVSNSYINIPFAWYVSYYICFIILSPVLLFLYKKRSKRGDKETIRTILATICILVAIYIIFYSSPNFKSLDLSWIITPLFSSLVGLIVAKHNLFDRLSSFPTSNHSRLTIIILLLLTILFRNYYKSYTYAPSVNWSYMYMILNSIISLIFITLTTLFFKDIKNELLTKYLVAVGNLSMYVWYIHGIFFTGSKFLQPYLYIVSDPILIFILCFNFCLIVSIATKYLFEKIVDLFKVLSRVYIKIPNA